MHQLSAVPIIPICSEICFSWFLYVAAPRQSNVFVFDFLVADVFRCCSSSVWTFGSATHMLRWQTGPRFIHPTLGGAQITVSGDFTRRDAGNRRGRHSRCHVSAGCASHHTPSTQSWNEGVGAR